MRVRGRLLGVGLVACGLLLAGCTAGESASSSASSDAEAGAGSTVGGAATPDYLWLLSAEGGTIVGADEDTGDEPLTLTLTGVNDHATQFADRPARDAYVISTPDFADRWDGWFGSTPPNAVLSYQLAGDVRPRTIVLEIDNPQYDAAAGTMTFDARHLHRESDPHPDAIAPIEVAPRPVPESFTGAALVIDSAADPAAPETVPSAGATAASGASSSSQTPASASPDPSAAPSSAAPPSAAASADPSESAPSASAPAVGAAAPSTEVATILGRVSATDLSLRDGQYAFDPDGRSTAGGETVATGASSIFETKVTGKPATSSFVYQVYELGTATGIWVRGEATAQPASSDTRDTSSCDFFQGNPADGASQLSTESEPYECTMTYLTTNDAGEYVVRYAVAPKVWATVRGSITPTGGLSLTSGRVEAQNKRWDYNGNAVTGPLAVEIVPSTKTDTWVAYHRNGDPNVHAARVDFAYQIVDDGAVTPYWVAGDSENYRGAVFSHDGTCAIYDGDPTSSEATEVEQSPYLCTAAGADVDGRQDWKVDFTVTPRPAQKVDAVTSPKLARDILTKGCADTGSTCSFIPLTVTDANLPGVQVSRKTANLGPEPVETDIEWTYRHAVRNSFGVEVDVETKEDLIIESVKASVKVKWSIAVTDTYTTTSTNTLTIPPGCSSWWELSPAYKEVTGDFVVSADGTLYRITGVTWTLPEAPSSAKSDGMSAGTLTARSEPAKGSTRKCTAVEAAG